VHADVELLPQVGVVVIGEPRLVDLEAQVRDAGALACPWSWLPSTPTSGSLAT